MDGIVQSWNKKSEKWVKIDTSKKAGILDMSNEKFPGVPVKKGKPKDEEIQSVDLDEGPAVEKVDPEENKPAAGVDDNQGNKDSGWFW